MFKQKEVKENPIETKRRELANAVLLAHRELIIATEETYAGEQSLAMIPAGWMRDMAEQEQSRMRLDLYNRIVDFDEKRLELREYCFNNNLRQGNWEEGLVMVRKHLQEILFHKK
jgi:hypothetical protein